jgi:hypothetical protein
LPLSCDRAGFPIPPGPMERTEIFQGVYLTVEDLPKSPLGSGRVMIAEIHWKTPGVRHREPALRLSAFPRRIPIASHYDLTFADRALCPRGSCSARQHDSLRAGRRDGILPGQRCPHTWRRSLRTAGSRTCMTTRTLLFWDENMEAHLQTSKPPSHRESRTGRAWESDSRAMQISRRVSPE